MSDSATDLEKSQQMDHDGVKRVKFESRRYKLVKVVADLDRLASRISAFLARWFRQAQCLSRSGGDLSGILRLGSSDQSSDFRKAFLSLVVSSVEVPSRHSIERFQPIHF